MTPSRLVRDGGALYLAADGKRLLLEGGYRLPTVAGPRALELPGGAVRLDPATSAAIRVGPVRLDLNEITNSWFESDALWGGPDPAAAVREVRRRRGLSVSLYNLTPAGDDALGVLSWTAIQGSGDPVVAQMLVRIRLRPKPAVEPLRPLDLPAGSEWSYGFSSFPCQRVLRFGRRLLLYLHPGSPDALRSEPESELVEIDAAGRRLRGFARLPSRHYPIGVQRDRWLILLAVGANPAPALWLYDLRQRRERPLPGDGKGVSFAEYICAPPDSDRLLVLNPGPGNASHSDLVTLPTGRRRSLPNPSGSVVQYLWEGRAILVNSPEGSVSIFSVTSGRLVERLPIPRPR